MVSHEVGPFCALLAKPESEIAKRLLIGAIVPPHARRLTAAAIVVWRIPGSICDAIFAKIEKVKNF
jgi:hypothetical protein